ncbi:hypothetical protein CROQUDRAFT_652542 [Cronartium quercuum f. sp. fusiforme G11]|uniref:Alpha/beta hydrolase fold-3 domain-containing protein n=1 Tax=Cronartium quercuum f. sp. fusiforme G11 TaxID=708437 RepID=A0A9P6NQV5_9BASI|nr:hypothetical protein CROQUDRAFT_652542 [Cronartium quercuum f. sp. fusiforme G11]
MLSPNLTIHHHQSGFTRKPSIAPDALQNLLAPFSSTATFNSDEPSNTQSHSTQPASATPTETKGKVEQAVSAVASAVIASVPGTSRVGVGIGQRVDPQITVRTAWRYVPFLTKQARNIATSFVSHHLYGPPKKSWGIEMTLFTAFVRDAASFSHLSTLNQLRMLLDLGHILPGPKDGIITPVSFPVKRLGLRGFLADMDAAEDGRRMLTGEWVLSKKTWAKMQTASLKRGQDSKSSASSSLGSHGLGDEKVIYFIHGGALVAMSSGTHRPLTISIAKYTECRLFAVNYRLAPETKFPGPLHDVAVGYLRLLNDLKIPAKNIVIAGDSAGGGLVVSLLLYLRDEGYPLPSGAILCSPWCDLTMSCDSWETNQAFDFLPMPKPDDPINPVKCYLGEEGIKKYITHPYVSPLFGDLHGLPPLLIQAGEAEVLRDEVTLLAHKASLHGVRVVHELYEDCVHVFQFFLFLEASKRALQSMRHFVRHGLPRWDQDVQKKAVGEPNPSLQSGTHVLDGSSDDTDRTDVDESTQIDETPAIGSDPKHGAVDREISSDAHLVDEQSQPVASSLPSSPTIPRTTTNEKEAEDNSSPDEPYSSLEPKLSAVQLGKRPEKQDSTMHKASLSLQGQIPSPNLSPFHHRRSHQCLDASSESPRHTRAQPTTGGMFCYSACQAELLTPQIVRGDGRDDVRELVSELIETPSLLRTTVYRQQDGREADGYFWSSSIPTTEEKVEEEKEEEVVELLEPRAAYPFQTPGYGFS